MRECSKCNAEATLVATKRFHTFTIKNRYYCDKCYAIIEKKDDLVLLFSLIASLVLLTASIFLFINTRKNVQQTKLQAIEIQRQAKDFDNDGVVDIWEQQATDKQIKNFNTLGYPCEEMEETKTASRPMLAVIPAGKWIDKFNNDKVFRNTINFPTVMANFIEKYTNPESKVQLDNLLLTTTGEIAFVLKRFSDTQKNLGNQEIKENSEAGGKAENSSKPAVDATVCYEKLSTREARQIVKILDIPPDRLTAAYR